MIAACTGQIGGFDDRERPPVPRPDYGTDVPYAMPPTPARTPPAFAAATGTPFTVAAVPTPTPPPPLPTLPPLPTRTPTPIPTAAPAVVPTPTAPPVSAPATLVTPAPVAPTPIPAAVTYTLPLPSFAAIGQVDERPEFAEIVQTARRYPKSRIYLTAYASENDARDRGSDLQTVSNELVIRMAQVLSGRGIEASRISGKGLGANPNVGRAIVVSLDVVAEDRPNISARDVAERAAALDAPDRFPRENTAFKEVAGSPAYRIGRGDNLSVTIWYTAGPQEFKTRVSPAGTVSFDVVEEAPVAGLTILEAKSLITNILKRYIRNPRVTVVVSEFASRSVTVVGPDGPRSVSLQGRTTLLDLLAREQLAPATTDLKNVRVVRGSQEFQVNLFRTILDGDWKENLVLDDGDVVYLPTFTEAGSYVVVLGAVGAPGLYPIRLHMNAVEALFLAGGAAPQAYLPHARIIRGDVQKPELVPADIDLVLDKGRLDAHRALEPGDVLYVPRTRISNWNEFLRDVRPTIELATLPFRSVGAALLFGRDQRDVTTTTNIVIFPTPGVPLP